MALLLLLRLSFFLSDFLPLVLPPLLNILVHFLPLVFALLHLLLSSSSSITPSPPVFSPDLLPCGSEFRILPNLKLKKSTDH